MHKIKLLNKEIILILVMVLNLISPFLLIENHPTIRDDLKGNELIESDLKSSSTQNLREGYAIICGVSDYPGIDYDLNYCDDDAEDLYDFIQSNYHIPDENIIKLIDSEVTISNISNSISSISSQMDSNDVLFFSYSGHGGADLGEITQQSWSIQSTHPYSNWVRKYWHLSVPGAAMMRVHFSKIDVEYGYDTVYIGDNDERTYYYDMLTGYYTDVWSNWVMCDDIFVFLFTDESNTDWGFEVDMVEVVYFQAPYSIIPYDGLESGLSGTMLNSMLNEVPGQVVTVLDSCNSGGVGQNIAQNNRYILTACGSSEYSLDDAESQNGVFTYEFLNSWNNSQDINNDGVISFEENFNELYDGSVSRSTTMGSPFHPIEFDGIDDELILEPNGKINSINLSGDDNVIVEFALSGLGGGKLVLVYYDFEEKNIVCSEISENLQNGADWQQRIFAKSLPNQEINGITFRVVQSYQTFSEIDCSSIQFTDLGLSNSSDYDGDSLSDAYEFEIGFNTWDDDWDEDGLTDDVELRIGTDSLYFDTDDDGMPDGWEYYYRLNPLVADANEDPDSDGLINSVEYFYGTDPLKADTDNDNYSDKEEIERNTNPLKSISNPLMRGVLITGGIVGFLSISFVVIKRKYFKPSDSIAKRSIGESTRNFQGIRENSSTGTYSDNYKPAKIPEDFDSFNFENIVDPIAQNVSLKFCSNCGSPILDKKFAFCVTCGHRIL